MKALKPYFSHDIDARGDIKIKKLLYKFGYEGYGLYWALVEFLHENELFESDVEILASDFRADTEKLRAIIYETELFDIEDGKIISGRVNRNLSLQDEKRKKAKTSASTRWKLSGLKKVYLEIFGQVPILNEEEIEKFFEYSRKIDEFEEKLPDILYTVKLLKFDNNPSFNPSINWLLTKNNLTKLLNGEFGKLKSWQMHKEEVFEKTSQKEYEKSLEKQRSEEFYSGVTTKKEAMNCIAQSCGKITNMRLLPPDLKKLAERFEINKTELKELLNGT